MLGLLKEAAVGGVMGGLAGTAFYGVGKAFGFLKDSIKDVRGNKGGSPAVNSKPSKVNDIIEVMKEGEVSSDGRRIITQLDDRTKLYLDLV